MISKIFYVYFLVTKTIIITEAKVRLMEQTLFGNSVTIIVWSGLWETITLGCDIYTYLFL